MQIRVLLTTHCRLDWLEAGVTLDDWRRGHPPISSPEIRVHLAGGALVTQSHGTLSEQSLNDGRSTARPITR